MPRKNVLDVFEDFPKTSASLTFRHLCLLIPPIRPRPYSICSSYESDRERISLLITEVEYETNLRRRKIYGSCSTYLRSLLAGAEILVKIDTTTFDFKQISANHNLLLVACGSAISPFLAYLSHLEHLLTCGLNSHASDVEKPIEYDIPGSIKMYFGCRYLIEDNFILNTFEMLQSRGILEVFLCPSREAEMIYVQNKIKQHSTSLQSFLCGKQSHIFIAG
ncbi:MAG: NADPH-dependent diflavin oxidoreductase 1 [Marteilia pararefringens]